MSQEEIEKMENKFNGRISRIENLSVKLQNEIQKAYDLKKSREEWNTQVEMLEGNKAERKIFS